MTSVELTWLFQDWIKSRPYRRLWRSIPAILTMVSLVIFALWITGVRSAVTRTDYSRIAVRALARRDYPTARVACERLLTSGSESRPQHLFYLALAMKGLGQEQDAAVLMRLAAPLDKPGSVDAHLLVAKTLLGGTNLAAQTVATAETHLKHALVLEPNSAEVNELLGKIYMQRQEWDLAKDQLMRIMTVNPRALLLLAVVSRESGDDVGARGWAERAVKLYRDRIDRGKVDSPPDRMAWAQGLIIQEKYAEALKALEDGRKQVGRGVYEPALAEVCAAWAQALAVSEPRNLAQRVKLVQQGLGFAPENLKLLQLLVQLSHLEGREGQDARAAITRMMGEGGSAAILHFVLGGDEWERGNIEGAGKHFALAFELAPNLPVVANNMAAYLALGQKPDLPRALAIVQALVEKYPDDPYFRDTRGQIYVRLKRWSEAVKDLEYALPRLPSKAQTHAGLAAAYRGLGMPDLATEHERLAVRSAQSKSR